MTAHDLVEACTRAGPLMLRSIRSCTNLESIMNTPVSSIFVVFFFISGCAQQHYVRAETVAMLRGPGVESLCAQRPRIG